MPKQTSGPEPYPTIKMTKYWTGGATLDPNDECGQCGRRLKDKREAWATDRGNFCTIRCAEEHEIDMRLMEERDEPARTGPAR